MKKRTAVFITIGLFVIVGTAVFLMLPTIDPITLEYWDMSGRTVERITDLTPLRYYVAMWKGTLMRGHIDFSFRYLWKAISEPYGILFVVGLFYLFTVVIWVYVSWLVGSRKGKPWLGVLLGLVLGFIGLIIMLLLPEDQKTHEAEQLASGEYRKCPFCAEPIRSEAAVCRYCGRDVPRATETVNTGEDSDR